MAVAVPPPSLSMTLISVVLAERLSRLWMFEDAALRNYSRGLVENAWCLPRSTFIWFYGPFPSSVTLFIVSGINAAGHISVTMLEDLLACYSEL